MSAKVRESESEKGGRDMARLNGRVTQTVRDGSFNVWETLGTYLSLCMSVCVLT